MGELKGCFNCGNMSGDKTDCSDANPCTNCCVQYSLGYVDLIPEGQQENWIPRNKEKNKNYESDDKMVSHPDHYQTKSGLETIQVIEAFTDGLEGIEAVCTANVIKYICRWKKKNGLQDLKKAQWYLTYLINRVEENGDYPKFVVKDIDATNIYATRSLEETEKESK